MKLKDLFIEAEKIFDILFESLEKQVTLEVLDRNIQRCLNNCFDDNKKHIFNKLKALSIEHKFDECSTFEDLENVKIYKDKAEQSTLLANEIYQRATRKTFR